MGKKMRYACIGAGKIAAKKHLSGYASTGLVEICAVCDTNAAAAERLAAQYGAKAYTDYEAMLAEVKPDIVSVCTPNCLHREITVKALYAGANVHCERPMAISAEEAEEIMKAERETGKMVMIGLNKRFLAETFLVNKLLEEDFFGDIYYARCGWIRNSGIPGVGKWFSNQKLSGGGVLIDLGVHYLDLLLHFMGYPEIEGVYGATFRNFPNDTTRVRKGYDINNPSVYDVEDTAVGSIRTKSGAMMNYEFSWASNIEKEVRFVELTGTRGGMSMVNDEVKLFRQVGDVCVTMKPDAETYKPGADEFHYFIYCIESGKKPEASSEQGYRILKIIDAAYQSAREHREVKVS